MGSPPTRTGDALLAALLAAVGVSATLSHDAFIAITSFICSAILAVLAITRKK